MSDHNSSPRAVAEPAVDLADNYVFPSPFTRRSSPAS